MSQVVVGTTAVRAPVPLYEIHPQPPREVTRKLYSRVPLEGGKPGQTVLKVEEVTETLEESFLVYFPGGHAVSFDSVKHMQEAGIHTNEQRLVDPETGDVVGQAAPLSLRARSEAKQSLRPNRSGR